MRSLISRENRKKKNLIDDNNSICDVKVEITLLKNVIIPLLFRGLSFLMHNFANINLTLLQNETVYLEVLSTSHERIIFKFLIFFFGLILTWKFMKSFKLYMNYFIMRKNYHRNNSDRRVFDSMFSIFFCWSTTLTCCNYTIKNWTLKN